MAQIHGTNPGEIAKRDKVSEATTQHRIRAVFGKTGTHRQAELIRTLAGIVGVQR